MHDDRYWELLELLIPLPRKACDGVE